jgi:hypothetical protein
MFNKCMPKFAVPGFVMTLALALLGVLFIGLPAVVGAQGPEPQNGVSAQASLGTAFTYQGRLEDASGPVNGTCDLRFTLYNSASGTTTVGNNPQTRTNVTLGDGYFTVGDLDFGASAFNGEARWMEIQVRCPAGSGSYTALSPRVALNPAPYALALPGLWTQQNATSPNLIGGYSGNSVTAGVYGATIGGGGEDGFANRVTVDHGTVGGGGGNQAITNTYTTVGGGLLNTASGSCATVGGGWSNTASGNVATVAGGFGNTASDAATVGGGDHNTASNGGTIGGGWSNTASGLYATVPGGSHATASLPGQMAYASGDFFASGDAQTSAYVMRNATTTDTGTWNDLYLDGSSALLTIDDGRTLMFDILLVGRSDGGESAGYYIWGVIENVGGATMLFGGPVSGTALGEDDTAWNVRAVGDDLHDALAVQVMGNGETIRWVAVVRTAEVAW